MSKNINKRNENKLRLYLEKVGNKSYITDNKKDNDKNVIGRNIQDSKPKK